MSTQNLKIGSAAPDFNLPAADGKVYSLSSFKEKTALAVIFWCNHCPYVKAYESRIIQLQNEYSDVLAIAAINSNDSVKYPEDSFENMKVRSEERGFNFKYLRDEDQSVARAFDATHTPEIFLFDNERRLVFHGKIDDNWQDAEAAKAHYFRNAIDEVLAGENVSVPETFTIGCTIKWK